MLRVTFFGCALTIAVLALSGCGRSVSFKSDVKPILDQHCKACHMPGTQGYESTGFSVADYNDVMKGTKFGPIIDPGHSGKSTLVVMLEYGHDPVAMPRGGAPLPKDQIALIKRWIDQGAKDN